MLLHDKYKDLLKNIKGVSEETTTGVFPTFCASLRQEIVNKSEDGFKADSALKANSSISFTGSIINTCKR